MYTLLYVLYCIVYCVRVYGMCSLLLDMAGWVLNQSLLFGCDVRRIKLAQTHADTHNQTHDKMYYRESFRGSRIQWKYLYSRKRRMMMRRIVFFWFWPFYLLSAVVAILFQRIVMLLICVRARLYMDDFKKMKFIWIY